MIRFNIQYNWIGDSSAVRALYYDRTNGLLNAEYKDKNGWISHEATWRNVTWDDWKQLTGADSVGAMLNRLRREAGWVGVNNDDVEFIDEDDHGFVAFEEPTASAAPEPLFAIRATRPYTAVMSASLLADFLRENPDLTDITISLAGE